MREVLGMVALVAFVSPIACAPARPGILVRRAFVDQTNAQIKGNPDQIRLRLDGPDGTTLVQESPVMNPDMANSLLSDQKLIVIAKKKGFVRVVCIAKDGTAWSKAI